MARKIWKGGTSMIILTGMNFYIDDKFITSLSTIAGFLTINLVFLFVANIVSAKTGKQGLKIVALACVILFVIILVWTIIGHMTKQLGSY